MIPSENVSAAECKSTRQNTFRGYFYREYIFASTFFPIIMFKTLDQLIKRHSDDTEDNDGSDHHAQLEEMESANDRDGYIQTNILWV